MGILIKKWRLEEAVVVEHLSTKLNRVVNRKATTGFEIELLTAEKPLNRLGLI